MAFKDNLVTIRKLRNKDPMDVVNGTGVDKQQYYAWEKGKYKPSDDNLDLLCVYLKVPKSLFFKETVTEADVMDDKDWYRDTIQRLIHMNSETVRETFREFKSGKKEEIDELRKDKHVLNEHVRELIMRVNPPQEGKQ